MANTTSTFTADEMRALEQERILLPSNSGASGKRKFSASFLTPPSSHDSNSSLSSSSTASVSYRHYALDPNSEIEIPLAEESPEALEFMGFTPEVAGRIYNNFSDHPPDQQLEDDFLEFAYGQANLLNLEAYHSMPPTEALTRIGIKKSLRDGILDPNFGDIFGTQTLLFWVRDSLRINYWTLIGLQSRLKEHVKHASKKAKRGSISDIFPAAGSSSSSQPTVALSAAPSSKHLPSALAVVQEAAPLLDDHILLYKGKSEPELIEERQLVVDDGNLNMQALASAPGGDFNFDSSGYYFTTERETAERYRQYIARRHKSTNTWLIQIQVPKTFLDGLTTRELWYGPDWREYVWHCRRQRKPPSKYDLYWRLGPGSVEVIRGAICKAITAKIHKIKKEDIHVLMTEQEVVMKCGHRHAVQVMFTQFDVAERLGKEIKGKIYITVFPPLKTEKK